MEKTVALNKRVRYDYEVLESYEAGIMLTGPEVKSVKSGQISIKEAFVTFQGQVPYLTNAHVSPYKMASNIEQNPIRPRKILLKKSEISSLLSRVKTQGLTLVPSKIYLKRGLVKVEVVLGRGKKQYDKRESIKKKEQKREIERESTSKFKEKR